MESSYNILPECYPYLNDTTGTLCLVTATDVNYAITSQEIIIKKFPPIFDRQIKRMEGEKFHVLMTEDTKLFCVNAPEQYHSLTETSSKQSLSYYTSKVSLPQPQSPQSGAPRLLLPSRKTRMSSKCVLTYSSREIYRYQSANPAQAVPTLLQTVRRFSLNQMQ